MARRCLALWPLNRLANRLNNLFYAPSVLRRLLTPILVRRVAPYSVTVIARSGFTASAPAYLKSPFKQSPTLKDSVFALTRDVSSIGKTC